MESEEATVRKEVKGVCEICCGSGIDRVNAPNSRNQRVGTICRFCDGKGWTVIAFTPFVQRRVLNSVDLVQFAQKCNSHGAICQWGDIEAEKIPYAEFLNGKLPHENKSFHHPMF